MTSVLSHFGFEGEYSCRPCGNGHINDTFEIGGKYILQRINTRVFPDVERLMDNIGTVTAVLRRSVEAEGEDPARRVLRYLPADTGKLYYIDTDGQAYRMCDYIADSYSPDTVSTAEDMHAAGVAFGRFQKHLAQMDASCLTESIPDFHNTPKRWATFLDSVRCDAVGRRAQVTEEIALLEQFAERLPAITERFARLPLRVTHNDAKLGNVLLDRDTHAPLCVIDLDTVMPGYAANDFGDAIRTGASTAAEDETDLSAVRFSLERFAAFAEGFLGECADSLTKDEICSLPYGCLLMTFEQAVRFLTDYLDGDRYYKTARAEHNLDRTRTQLRLLCEMEERFDRMCQISEQYTIR